MLERREKLFAGFAISAAILFVLSGAQSTSTAGRTCQLDSDCNGGENGGGVGSGRGVAECQDGRCSCPPYHLLVNGTTCLPGRLLGFKCSVDAQCRVRVPMSGCVQGVCQCSDGYTQYRKANCLPSARVGDSCRALGQCRASSPNTYCNYSIPRVLGRCACSPEYETTEDGLCASRKLGLGSQCSTSWQCHARVRDAVCVLPPSVALFNRITSVPGVLRDADDDKHRNSGVCECPKGYAAERTACVPLGKEVGESAVSLGERCSRTSQCQAADPHSRCSAAGVCDCAAPTHACSASNTGCHPDTFQCVSSGRCISSHFVCDGVPHCLDGSDEAQCQGGRCSSHSFRCRSGRCVSRGVLCNGRKDCEDGADEEQCHGDCPVSTFRCSDGRCLPGFVFCNARATCSDGSDEDHRACVLGAPRLTYCPFRCNNGRCRSLSVLCSGRDGCGDNSDEERCAVCACPPV